MSELVTIKEYAEAHGVLPDNVRQKLTRGTLAGVKKGRDWMLDIEQPYTEMPSATVVRILADKGWHIAAAESCTAGLFSSELAAIPGASEVMEMSFVTYSETAKQRLVRVKEETIRKYGVVSKEVAGEMAEGVAKVANAEIGIGITGYAGPSGGTDSVPTGTICIGYFINGKTKTLVFHENPSKGRNAVRKSIVIKAMKQLSQLLVQSPATVQSKGR